MKVFAGINDEVDVYINETQMTLVSETMYFTTRLVDGNYPNYQQIIPQEFKTTVQIEKQDLVDSLRLVNIFSDNFNQIKMVVDGDKFALHSRNTDVGENETQVNARVEGDPLNLFVNHRYVSDSLPVIESSGLTFSFFEANRPFILTGDGQKDFLYLIMPMNR